MPKKDCILNLPGFSIQKVIPGNPMVLEVNYRRKAKCPGCGNRKLRNKDSFMREVRHETFGIRRTLLRFKAHKFYCYFCKHYFHQCFPGIAKHKVFDVVKGRSGSDLKDYLLQLKGRERVLTKVLA